MCEASPADVSGAIARQRAVQAQPIADHHERSDVGAAEVDDGAAEEVVELLFVDDGRARRVRGRWSVRCCMSMISRVAVTASVRAPSTPGILPRGARVLLDRPRGAGRLLVRPRNLTESARTTARLRHGRPFRTAARREAVGGDVLHRRVLEAVARALAALGDARPATWRPNASHVIEFHLVTQGARLHAGRRGDDAVRRRRPPDGSARRRARDGQRHGRAAHRRRARVWPRCSRAAQALADRRRWRGDAARSAAISRATPADPARARRAAARGARAHAQRSRRRMARALDPPRRRAARRRPRPAAT